MARCHAAWLFIYGTAGQLQVATKGRSGVTSTAPRQHKLNSFHSDGPATALPTAPLHRSQPLATKNMPKRAATDARTGPEKASRRASAQAREKPPEDEMGEFEDAWEDEIADDDAEQSDGVCFTHAVSRLRRLVG